MNSEIDKIKKYAKDGEQDGWINFSWEKLVEIIAKQIKKESVYCKDLMSPTILCALGIESDHPDKEKNLGFFLKELGNADKALDFLLNYAQHTEKDYEWIVEFFTNRSYGLAGIHELNETYLKFIEKIYREKATDWILWSLICLINYDKELLPVYIKENESTKDALRRHIKEDSFPAPLTFINNLLEKLTSSSNLGA